MFVRMATFRLLADKAEEAAQTYAQKGAPLVRQQPGNQGCFLLEPVEPGADHVACTLWATEANAQAYEQSGLAQQVANLLRPAFAGPPQLRTFRSR